MKTHSLAGRLGGAFICAFFGTAAMQAQVGIYGTGTLTGSGAPYSEVRSAIITSDGSIVAVGGSNSQSWHTTSPTATDTAVLWTKGVGAGVLTALPPIVAPDVNNLGRVVSAGDVTETTAGNILIAARSYYNATAGFSTTNPNAKAEVLYHYTVSSGTATYGSTAQLSPNVSAGNQNAAIAISRDGSVVYGFANMAGNVATRWTSVGGLVNLGRAGGTDTDTIPAPRGVSSNGSIMVGTTTLADAITTKAFIYNNTTSTFTTIGTLPGGTNSQALAVSANGNIVFGSSQSTAHPNGEAFFYNATTSTFTALGTPNNAWVANITGGITADGAAAIANFYDPVGPASVNELFNSHGMFELTSVLTAAGINTTGWSNLGIWGMSQDGQLIYGSGIYGGITQGFVAQLPLGFVSAIPEPATDCELSGLAALGFVLQMRRRRRTA